MRMTMTLRGLLFSTALVAPAAAFAQPAPNAAPAAATPPVADAQAQAPQAEAQPPEAQAPQAEAQPPEPEIEISAPGAQAPQGPDIVIRGTRVPNNIRRTPQVISVLSHEEIARTGEGDIAGALSHVTGLSVVGNGFVYVRGLGDRYSLALLNGSPLPSPEPLRRVIPLDIFPTSVIASAVVQKSYSANYPGEFGGGVINLTTPAVPRESFLDIGLGTSGDTETTFQLGYSYYGSDTDPTGFDDGTRDFPAALRNVMAAGAFNATTDGRRRDFAASLVNAPTTLAQRLGDVPANFSGEISGGTSTEIRGGRIGFIANVGYSNTWRSRDALQQSSQDPGLAGIPQSSYQAVTTDNRIIVNGLLGLGAEFGRNRIRWTSLYIRDTLKQTRLAAGYNRSISDPIAGRPPSSIEQNTYWLERQLIDTQLVGEFHFGGLNLEMRGGYANSQRESPYERAINYFYLGDGDPATRGIGDVDDYVNNLTSGGQSASIAFSDLNENVWSGALDLSYRFDWAMPLTLSGGYAYTRTDRTSSRYQFAYFSPDGALPVSVAQERPDYLLSDFNVYTFNIQLRDVSGVNGAAAYDAGLRINAGYAQAELEATDTLRAIIGVRMEDADQFVSPIGNTVSATQLSRRYFLPSATLTWRFTPDMQLRLAVSKTIARPQFRELAQQVYQDFESDREFTGNPFLTDSQLYNAEARYEWYFARDQRVSLAGFYKRLDHPIEAAAFFAGGGQLRTGFANAPRAELYGAEFEVQAYLPLSSLGGSFFATRRLLFIGNYTYSKSSVSADSGTIIGPDLQPVAANVLFQDGAPMVGQSEHLANLQFGIENTDHLSQATFILSYASDRVTNRGPIQGLLRQPDLIEHPGFRLDFVLRQEVPLFGSRIEFKFEARNLTGQDYSEFQQAGDNRIEVNSYRLGQSYSLGATIHF